MSTEGWPPEEATMITPPRSRHGIARAMPLLALSALVAGTAALLASAPPAHAPISPTTRPAHAPVSAASVPARAPSIERPDEYVGVATRSGHDWITGAEIDALLRHHGIDSYQEGSLGYGVWVRRKDARRAEALIRQDAQEVGYRVLVDRDVCGREPP